MWDSINKILANIDDFVWGVPLMAIIITGGILLTFRLGFLQLRRLGLALKWMVKNEEGGKGEISSFAALCTALSATIGTGNIVGVATAVGAGGPGALFWMVVTALFGMATKYAEGLLAVKYRVVDKDNHSLGGPFYYIELGMGQKFKWLAKIFAFFGVCVGLFGIGTFSQVNGISSAVQNFFDPNKAHTVSIPGIGTYSWTVVIASLILAFCVGAVLIGGIKRIASVSQIIVPFMAIIYFIFAVMLVICNITKMDSDRLFGSAHFLYLHFYSKPSMSHISPASAVVLNYFSSIIFPFLPVFYANAASSKSIVNGPSFIKDTFISAPKIPVSTTDFHVCNLRIK